MKPWLLGAFLFVAGCQAQVAGQEPPLPTMPPAKGDDPTDDPTDDPAATCGGADCEQDPGVPAAGDGLEREPNDAAEIATPIGVPVAVVTGELVSGDHDYFAVRIVQRGGYIFETSTGDLGDDDATDTVVGVYGAGGMGDPVASDDDSGEGLASRAAVHLSPGQYFVEVSGFGGAVTGPYTLEVRGPEELEEVVEPEPEPGEVAAPLVPAAQADESEENDTIATANSMGDDPASIGAELEEAGVDHFVFAVDGARTVTIETAARLEGGSSVDTIIELYAADGVTMIGSDDDSADVPLFSRLTVDLPAAGVYYLRVRGYSDASSGQYRAVFLE